MSKVQHRDKSKNFPPLVKWSGGKKDELKNFVEHIPNNIDTYLEPFVGGGTVLFHLNHPKNVISDVHEDLMSFYEAMKEGQKDDIYEFMETHENIEKTYYEVRDKMEINSNLDRAKRFYYLRKTCFRGMNRYNMKGKFNVSFGRYDKINYSLLEKDGHEKVLKNCEIFTKDFSYIFENYNDENNFMFLDPPYDAELTDYGYCKFGKEEHKKLAEHFKNTKIRCLMIIGKTRFIEELYKDYIVDEYDKTYRIRIHSGRINSDINNKHLIIKNY